MIRKKLKELFGLRRDERWPVLACALALAVLNGLVVCRYYHDFAPLADNSWKVIVSRFRISGFDPTAYEVLTHWNTQYVVYRHPLLAFFLYLPYLLNQGLMAVTGINCALFIVAAINVLTATYAYLFLYRTVHEIVGIGRRYAWLLATMCMSYAYVMTAAIVPDHFIWSMSMLLLLTYMAGRHIKNGTRFGIVQTVLLFVFTAGISLNNGIKVFLAALFTNGRRFFRPQYLLLAVVVPAALMWCFARWEYRVFVLPGEKQRHAAKRQASEQKRQRDYAAFRDTTRLTDSVEMERAFGQLMKQKVWKKYQSDHQKPWNQHKGEPFGKGEFMRWTDRTTDRWASAVENLFGESLLLHRRHLLEDTLRSRPVIVGYEWPLCYWVEGAVVLLFVLGIIAGRRSRFLWMVLSCFATDMALHVGLGFGLNEVYIMTAHWAYALPVATAYLLRPQEGTFRRAMRRIITALLCVLTLYLLCHNLYLLVGYLV